jgi:hypothetical protein
MFVIFFFFFFFFFLFLIHFDFMRVVCRLVILL